ncbi:MAG: FliM/FliN family flagellar motor switch protein [Parvularculaceae bacterium]
MPTNESSLLARKIAAGRPKLDAFPAMKEFADATARCAATAIGELLQCDVQAEISGSAVTALSDALMDGADPGVYHWIEDNAGEPAALVSISPAFSVLTMERLLGGDLQAPQEAATSNMLDFRMSESLVDVVMAALSALLQEQFESSAHIRPRYKRSMRTPKEASGEDSSAAVFRISLDLRVEDHSAAGAFGLCFPIGFVERLGLMRRRKPAAGAQKNTLWTAQLRRNILNCELPLPIVLYRFATSVGDLSRLKVGQIVDLDPNALQSLEVTAMTNSGAISIANGRLGAYRKRKAVKLTTDIDKSFIGGL